MCWLILKADFGVATCCCNNHFNELFLCYGVSILVIDPMDSAVLGMINVKILYGKSIFAGKVGCWRVKTRVKTTDMCLSGQRVADMLAGMSAT
jgi:hypothetical protein